jgi:hypothetical protein
LAVIGSAEAQSVPAVKPEALFGPAVMPDRVILTWSGDPATSQSVTWRTNTEVVKGIAQYAPATPDKSFVKNAKEVVAETQPLESPLGNAHYHSVTLKELQPKTKYCFRVGDGMNWTEWNQFTTASTDPEPFTFIYFGDAQNDVREHWSRVIRGSFADAAQARFFLHAGDLINNANSDEEWGQWHGAAGFLNSMISVVATPGNHEYATVTKPAPPAYRLSQHWRPQFAFPTNGPPGLEETVYSLDYQGARVVVLNSNERFIEQVSWLDSTLAGNPNRWTIVTFHHPIYSTAAGRDNPVIRKLWQPIFDKYKVDLVLQGHDHTYGRSSLLTVENVPTGANVQAGTAGTVYVVSVSGPKMYNVERRSWMRRAAANTQLYQIITVNNDELLFEARTAAGDVYDAFTLKKREGQPNELIDRIPDVPERLE